MCLSCSHWKEEESDPDEAAFTRAGNSNYLPFLIFPHTHTLTVRFMKPFSLIHKDDHSLYETITPESVHRKTTFLYRETLPHET